MIRRRIRKNSLIVKQVRKILRDRGITYRFYWDKFNYHCNAESYPKYNHIKVYCKKQVRSRESEDFGDGFRVELLREDEFLSYVFHEMAHVLIYRLGLYPVYLGCDLDVLREKGWNKWIKEMLPAERAADRLGKRMMLKYFNNHAFIGWYGGEIGKKLVEERIANVKKFYNF